MSEEFGSGVHLDKQFDFSVGSTGDLKFEDGLSELEKDLAFQMVFTLSKFLGRPPGGTLKEEVISDATRVAEVDERVDFVEPEKTKVTFSSDRQELRLKMLIQAEGEQQELVFDI